MGILDIVARAIRNARENGYEIDSYSVEELAEDILDCDADAEIYDFDKVVEAVRRVRAEDAKAKP